MAASGAVQHHTFLRCGAKVLSSTPHVTPSARDTDRPEEDPLPGPVQFDCSRDPPGVDHGYLIGSNHLFTEVLRLGSVT
jgi:hypothetical protein